MRRIFEGTAALTLLLTCVQAHADANDHNQQRGLQLGAGISLTEGAGVELRYPLTDNISLRSTWYGFNHSDKERIGSVDFKLDLSFSTAGGFIDFNPGWESLPGLRVTAGLLLNNDDLRGTGLSRDGYYRIGGHRIPEEMIGELKARARYNRTQPYLGLGYTQTLSESLSLATELGVLFQGSPTVSYSVSGPIQSQPDFKTVLQTEQKKAEDDLDDYRYRPVARFTLLYRF